MDLIQLKNIDLLQVHRAALAQYEQDAAECDANGEPLTAQMFRDAAERRRRLIQQLERVENEQTESQSDLAGE